MYQVATIPVSKYNKIAQLPINAQSDIEKAYGTPLQLTKVISLIKQVSENFEKDHPAAKKADRLLAELLTKKGFLEAPKPAPAPEKEMTPEEMKIDTENALAGLKTLMKYLEGEDAKDTQLAIDGLETLLKYM